MKSMQLETADGMVQKIAGMRRELSERFSVTKIGVFGSFARGEARPDSDVDILVELAEPSFDHYLYLAAGNLVIWYPSQTQLNL